ncbi:MAG: pre-peptidase C-terminal domain-containing protein [Verrucomicrobiales bacterium]|nr:pre-peptidase C-terminal domain-containing protein [Verrucomicrobiales bacterium]
MIRFSFLATLTFLLCSTGFAGVKNVERVTPRFGQQGTVVEVEIWGTGLENPKEIAFYKPGIRAYDFKIAAEQPKRRVLAHGGYYDSAISCKFEIAPDCEPGQHPFRLLTATQLTHIASFHVTPFRTIEETPERKDKIDIAMPVSANVTINAKLGHDMADFYHVPVKAGQELSVELDSVRISDSSYGDSTYDLAVQILDSEGREIAANDDNSFHTQDPVLSTMIKEDGHVYVVARRSVEQITQTTYALHIGTNRRPIVAFPPGGEVGKEQQFRLIGSASGDFQETIKVPTDEGNFGYFGGAVSPVNLRASRYPNIEENLDDSKTKIHQTPVALNGIIDRHDDTDVYLLTAKKGEPLHLRVFASALGSPIDPVLQIIDSDGNIELESDDAPLTDRDIFGTSYRAKGGRRSTLDPSIIWEPKKDGEYRIEISDTSGAGGPTGVYRIEIEEPRTVSTVVLQSKSFDWCENTRDTGLIIPRGGRHSINITFPKGQWNPLTSAFRIVAKGLPEGVSLVPQTIPAASERHGRTMIPIQFTSSPDTKQGTSLITLEAEPLDPDIRVENRCQENIPFLNHSGGDALHFIQVDKFVLGVTEPALFEIDIAEPKAALVRGGEIAIPVSIKRNGDFTGAVEYWVRFADGWISPQPPTVIPEGETESTLRLSTASGTPLGKLPLAVMGRSLVNEVPRTMGVGDRLSSTKIVNLQIAEPYMTLSSKPDSVRRGTTKDFRWSVTQKTPFTGKARVNLLGLPKGVSVDGEMPEIDSKADEVVFKLKATDEALLGQVTGLNCEVELVVAGEKVTQRTGKGSLRIDPAL